MNISDQRLSSLFLPLSLGLSFFLSFSFTFSPPMPLVLAEQFPSSRARSTDPSLSLPPQCTRLGWARQRGPRTGPPPTASPLGATASPATLTALDPLRPTATRSTPPSAVGSRHRFVHERIGFQETCHAREPSRFSLQSELMLCKRVNDG